MKKIKLFYVVSLVFLFITTLTGCDKAPEPRIKEGRFDFSVTYEVDGQVNTISSVFVCKFVMSGRHIDGYYRKWNGYIEDRSIEELFPEFHYQCIIVKTNEYGIIYLELNLYEEYFMSDPYYNFGCTEPRLFIEYYDDKAEEIGTYVTDDPEIIESYGVKIISFEYDEPIENIYE